MKVSEIFRSIQGEGPLTGRSATFLRLAGCNLGEDCPLDCDTKYSWKDNGYRMSKEGVAEALNDTGKNGDVTVITGGEPMLQEEKILELSKYIIKNVEQGWTSAGSCVETNGTIIPREDWSRMWVVSPKTKIDYESWKEFTSVHFKFVVGRVEEFGRINDIVREHDLDKNKVWIMPKGKSRRDLVEKRKEIVEGALRHGYNYSDRLQIVIWENKRRV